MLVRRTIDNAGGQLTLRTRQGGDLRCRLTCSGRTAQGKEPLNLADYAVVARVRDGNGAVRTLPTVSEGSAITLVFSGELTRELGSGPCNFAVELERDGTVTPLVYGTITCERPL